MTVMGFQGHEPSDATSAEAFFAIYAFLTGKAPRTTTILPDFKDQISLAGRVVIFPLPAITLARDLPQKRNWFTQSFQGRMPPTR